MSHAPFVPFARTNDGRYFVVRGRLWRSTNPSLPETLQQKLVKELMTARRLVRDAKDARELEKARRLVNAAKCALGERGPVWWTDGAPDYNQKMALNTPYAEWFKTTIQRQQPAERERLSLTLSRSTLGLQP